MSHVMYVLHRISRDYILTPFTFLPLITSFLLSFLVSEIWDIWLTFFLNLGVYMSARYSLPSSSVRGRLILKFESLVEQVLGYE